MKYTPEEVLQTYWGFEAFRPPQREIITHILQDRHTLVLLPTGGGKSLCYQVPAMCREGLCIVISPLVALIEDQVTALKSRGIKAIAITGGLSFDELNSRLDNAVYGNYKFLYLSPERLQQELVLERIKQMPVNLIAVDEAHCISQWGNDFRPAYRDCGALKDLFPHIPVIALTATATPMVVEDIAENLEITDAKVFSTSFSRPNLSYRIKATEDKLSEMERIVKTLSGSHIIYVRSRRNTVLYAQTLEQRGVTAGYFHGGMSAREKQEKLARWMRNDFRVMVATNAFGMGIDKADVRSVIHADLPDSLENYFQEAGRCGRDGKKSWAVLLHRAEDATMARDWFTRYTPDRNAVARVYNKLCNYLQLPYGEGFGEYFPLNVQDFSATYKFSPQLTYNALMLLDRNSVIELSEQFDKKHRVQFTMGNRAIFSYLDAHPSAGALIQLLLRSYGGIFDVMTPINMQFLSKRTGIEEKAINHKLEQLQQDGVIQLESREFDTGITFLQPREDQRTLNRIANDIDIQYRNKKHRLEKILDYLQTEQCLQNYLNTYFGQKSGDDCGNCTNCVQHRPHQKKSPPLNTIKEAILDRIKKGPLPSQQLALLLDFETADILNGLEALLREEEISINQKNEYYSK